MFCRLSRFDKRGTGLSDRVGVVATPEERMDDFRAIMDAAGSERAAILGFSEGGPMSILFSATHPHRTTTWARFERAAASPRAVLAILRWNMKFDIRRVLPTVVCADTCVASQVAFDSLTGTCEFRDPG
jgi:pimeloyl-ACP methyl ester carboxylesterase